MSLRTLDVGDKRYRRFGSAVTAAIQEISRFRRRTSVTVVRETVASRPADARTAATVRLVDGANLSWDEVVGALGPALAAYARSRGVRDPEDLVQDVFVAAVERADSFHGDLVGLRSLLFTIAFRRIADEHRRRYRRREVPIADHAFLPDVGPTTEEVVGRRESAGEAMEGFAALTQREQHVLRLRVFEEATPGEVGVSLGLTPGNVRVVQARALAKLRAYMRGRSGEVPGIAIGWAPLRFLSRLRRDAPASPLPSLTTETTSSVVSFLTGPGIARFGTAVSVAALSVGSVLPNVAGEIPPGPVGGVGAPEIQVQVPDTTHQTTAETHGEMPGIAAGLVEPGEPATDIPANLPAADAASDDVPTTEEPEVTTTQPDPVDNEGRPPDEEEPVSPADEPPTETTPGDSTGSPAQPLVDEVVDPLLDDVVQPLVGGVVEIVEETVQPVFGDVVDPLLDGITEPVLEEGGVVEEVEDLVEETGSLVEQLLGLP